MNSSEPSEVDDTHLESLFETFSNLTSFTQPNQTLLKVSSKILLYYSIVVVVLGNIFNLINFTCFFRMNKRNSQNIYLSALSLADLFNININILVPLLRINPTSLINEKLKTSLFLCKLDGVLVEIGLLLPVWIMVAVTAERYVSIAWPFRKSIFCTRRNAKILLSLLTLTIFLMSMYKLATAGVENRSTFHDNHCRDISLPGLVNASTILWAFIPEILTFILNIFIIRTIKSSTLSHIQFYPLQRLKRFNQATRMVIVLSIIFVVLISPTGFLIIVEIFLLIKRDSDLIQSQSFIQEFSDLHSMKTNLTIARKFALILFETNLIVNFPVYYFTFKNYRNSQSTLSKGLFFKRVDSTRIGLNVNNHKREFIRRIRIKNSVELELDNQQNQEQIKLLKYRKPLIIKHDSLVKHNTPTSAVIHYKIEIL